MLHIMMYVVLFTCGYGVVVGTDLNVPNKKKF